MNTPHLLLLGLSIPTLATEPPNQDREAILAMAGTHKVTFRFEETAQIAPDYDLKNGFYEADATEVVEVVEDSPTRITLQHLLVVGDEDEAPTVIKHWAQIWTWQDTEILDYCGSDEIHQWNKVTMMPSEVAGTWSQLVTQVDDTPRYESFGHWVHEAGESSWESMPTRRPLPRREYTKRDDYDYLLVTNRHTLSNRGWVHAQDNRKVVDREGEPRRVLCFESGLNRYVRQADPRAAVAKTWWSEHSAFWGDVREFWETSGEQAPQSFAYTTSKNGEALSKLLKRMQEKPPGTDEVTTALRPYVITK